MQTLILNSDGTRFWVNKDMFLHRKHGPAVEYSNGYKLWFTNGRLIREEYIADTINEFDFFFYFPDELFYVTQHLGYSSIMPTPDLKKKDKELA